MNQSSFYVDSHCHIDLSDFDNDRDEVLDKALKNGIRRILVPGLTNHQFDFLRDLAATYANKALQLDIALGLHPFFLEQELASGKQVLFDAFTRLAEKFHKQVVAFGESGLDGSLKLSMKFQIEALELQISLAKRFDKPLVLHHRQSHNELIRVLKQCRFSGGGVIHAFSGSNELARTYIDMGFVLGVGGTISYPRAKKTRATIQSVDLQHLLLETDAPDMPLAGFQGQRNTPAQIPLVAESLAQLKAIPVDEVAMVTSQNYSRVFSSS